MYCNSVFYMECCTFISKMHSHLPVILFCWLKCWLKCNNDLEVYTRMQPLDVHFLLTYVMSELKMHFLILPISRPLYRPVVGGPYLMV